MKNTTSYAPESDPSRWARAAVIALALALSGGAGLAQKPEWAGNGKPQGKNKHEKHGQDHRGGGPAEAPASQHPVAVDVRIGGYFGKPQRAAANAYYVQQFKGGRCPPGLAKKNNGCLPPGQAKKYAIGQPLPAGVVYYAVPAPVMLRLGAPPAGHKYVRVATDILLITVGTNMVIDAIEDLGRI